MASLDNQFYRKAALVLAGSYALIYCRTGDLIGLIVQLIANTERKDENTDTVYRLSDVEIPESKRGCIRTLIASLRVGRHTRRTRFRANPATRIRQLQASREAILYTSVVVLANNIYFNASCI